MNIALANCVENAQNIEIAYLIKTAKQAEQNKEIAPLSHLKSDNVWIYHGSEDSSVGTDVSQSLQEFYTGLSVYPEVEFEVPSGHGFPTLEFGVKCENSETPYLNNCAYDGAGIALQYLFSKAKLNSKEKVKGRLFSFSQADYLDDGAKNTLAEKGYLFTPESCMKGKPCRIHVAFHGCQQNADTIGLAFVENAGYNTWAEANNIVVIYPQTKSTCMPLNPKGCWDWWGYTGEDYLTRNGAQLKHIKNIKTSKELFTTEARRDGEKISDKING